MNCLKKFASGYYCTLVRLKAGKLCGQLQAVKGIRLSFNCEDCDLYRIKMRKKHEN